ncbi:MAG: hypothetical protein LC754_07495 [Acidobacteria bacterium]|nr:hypothetical protein [Acidobacteriota bacterium]
MSPVKKIILSASLCLACLVPASGAPKPAGKSLSVRTHAGQRRTRARRDPARERRNPAGERREKTFRLVWQTVKDRHYDQTFGGVDWDAVRARYAPRVAATRSDRELHYLLQAMVNELHESHFAIVPPESIPRFDRKKSGPGGAKSVGVSGEEETPDEEDDDEEGSVELATRMMNGVGLDVRVLNSQVVISRVAEGGAASKAGLRPGFAIKSVDGTPLESGARLLSASSGVSALAYFRMRQELLVNYLGGAPGTDVRLVYVDEQNKEHEVVIRRERLSGELSPPLGNLPPIYTEFETKRLPGEVGYLRFSTFTPQLSERICGALKSMSDARGIVIDLRGNPGGVMGMASGVTGLLTTKAGLIGALFTRKGTLAIPSFPQRSPYTGPLAILIDGLSGSTSEVFAAALQESGRAVVVGERSAGMVLGADTLKLPTGAVFMYAEAGFKTSRGTALEGRGVTPDVEKKLDRDSLLRGRDDQLEEALRQLQLRKSHAAEVAPPPSLLPVVVGAIAVNPTPADGVRAALEVTGTNGVGHGFESTPESERVMERYIQALGGREALGRVRSRVSTGTSRLPMQGMIGKVVIYEEAPGKRSMEMTIPNMGVVQIAYDGTRGWMQHPLMGFVEFDETSLPYLRRDSDFYKALDYKELYVKMEYAGARDGADVLRLTTPGGAVEEMRFDMRTGLLVYRGGAYYDDYRQVGDVKVPYVTRIPVAGLDLVITLTDVKQDVPVSADAFKIARSCFTQR